MSSPLEPPVDSARALVWWGDLPQDPENSKILVFLKRIIHEHHFNRRITVWLPGSEGNPFPNPPPEPRGGLFHYELSAPPGTFVEPEFMKTYIQQGKLCILPRRASLLRGCVAAWTPTGMLHMALDEDARVSLGLDTQASKIHATRKSRWNVSLSLRDAAYHRASPARDRLLWCMDKGRIPSVDFYACWSEMQEPESTYFGPIGTVQPMQLDNAQRVDATRTIERLEKIMVPVWENDIDTSSMMGGLVDWLGAIQCKAWVAAGGVVGRDPVEEEREKYWALVSPPCSTMHPGSGVLCSWKGFLPSDHVVRMVNFVKTAVDKGDIPWGCVSVHGFENAPTSVGQSEHGYGENDVVVWIGPEQWCVAALHTKNDMFS